MNKGSPHHEVILQTAGLSATIVLAEPTIFLSGFSKHEQQESSPALVRGSLILRITKPKKLKSVTLNFGCVSRTEWPEGIPSEKSETHETKDVFSHEWRLFSVLQKSAATSSGAHSVVSLDSEHQLALQDSTGGTGGGSTASAPPSSVSTGSVVGGTPHGLVNQQEAVSKGYRVFNPAEYVYNFELMLPHTLPETMKCNFGTVRWGFSLEIDRHGKFKPKLNAFKEVTLLRTLGLSNLESSEPIVISRDWEDLLHYEIIIAGKAFAIGQKFNVGIGLVRMAKVKCHRIRIYLTEHVEYYCRNHRIHRVEPSHKFLLLEHKSPEGSRGDLLNNSQSTQSELTEFEFDVEIPQSFPARRDYLHPNATTENIKVYHWIKAVMRLSRQDLSGPNESKCYEVSIDSPVTLVDGQTLQKNLLPDYKSSLSKKSMHNALKPYQKFIQEGDPQAGTTVPASQRAILFARKPSVAPPPFDADIQPPSLPPQYDVSESGTYLRRYEEYIAQTESSKFSSNSPETTPEAASAKSAELEEPVELEEPAPIFSEIYWSDAHPQEEELVDPATHEEVLVDPASPSSYSSSPLSSPSSPNINPSPNLNVNPSSPVLSTSPHSPSPSSSGTTGSGGSAINRPKRTPKMRTGSSSGSQIQRYSAVPQRKLSVKTGQIPAVMTPRSPNWTESQQQQLFGDRWMDRRDSISSVSSNSRYFRQSSVVSMDLSRQGDQIPPSPRPSHISEVEELREWHPLSRNNSESSVAVSVAEYQANSPLLRDDWSEVDMGLEWEHDFEDYGDRRSVTSAFYAVMTP